MLVKIKITITFKIKKIKNITLLFLKNTETLDIKLTKMFSIRDLQDAYYYDLI